MKQRRSEVFDEYSKIALKEGFITESEEKADNSGEKSYRETIQLLYDVKPNGKEEKHILDQAHPGPSVIIAPAYDRLNGRVENLFERQDVMVGIALKQNNGNLTQHRYAKQELTDELIRIGFEMDNKDVDDLRILADSCSERITKQAFWGWLALGGLGVSLIYALVKTHVTDKTSQGIFNDGVILIKDLKAASENAEPRDKTLMLECANEVKGLLEKVRAIRNLPQADVDMYKQAHIADIVNAGEKYKGAPTKLIESYIEDRKKVVNKLGELEAAIGDKSAEEPERYEFLADIRKVYNEVAGGVAGGTAESTFIDVKRAIKTFIDSLTKEDNQIEKVMTTGTQFLVKNEAAIKQQAEKASPSAPSQHSAYTGPAKPKEETAEEIMQSMQSLWK